MSGDARHIANACEALENLDSQDITKGLSEVLQKSINNDFSRDNDLFHTLDEVIRWCADHRNSWLSTCGDRSLNPINPVNNHA